MSNLDKLISKLDNVSRFGYTQENYGLAELASAINSLPMSEQVSVLQSRPDVAAALGVAVPGASLGSMAINQARNFGPISRTNYTINPAIQALTKNASTVQLTITVEKNGTGSGNTYNPVFLFGSDAFSNTSHGYTAVQITNPLQATAVGFENNKNTITFSYGTDPNTAVYTVSQTTDGEYPFFLNQLSGEKTMLVKGVQMTVGDVADVAQLDNTLQTFSLDSFGKSVTNDVSQPKDLYQLQTNGIWITNPFEISGKKGLKLNVNETDGMVMNLYMYVDPNIYSSK